MSNEKFQAGDRVIWLRTKCRGVIHGISHGDKYEIGLDVEHPEDSAMAVLGETSIEFEHIYDSPLYQALR